VSARVPWGKYAGQLVGQVPDDYLQWVTTVTLTRWPALQMAVHAEYQRRTAPGASALRAAHAQWRARRMRVPRRVRQRA
jgi:hypothetical protein